MNLTIEQLENIYNYIANRSNKDTSFPFSSYEDLNMFTGLNKENKNVLFKKEIIDDKFNTIVTDYNYKINGLNNLLQSEITDIKDNYIKKGNSDKTFILDNGERSSAIVNIDDEVDYNDEQAVITFVGSDNKSHIVQLESAIQDRAGLMSADDKKKLDNVTQDGGDAEFNSISNVEHIRGNEEGLNISNVNGVNALNGGSATEFWNTNGGKTDVGTNGLTTNGDIKVEGDNYITTINKSGGILIYDKTKGINTIDINGVDSKITFNVRQGNSYNTQDITLVPGSVLTTKSIKLTDCLYTENNYTNNKLYFGISSTNFLTKLNNLNTSFYSGIGANCDFGVVYNNKSVVIKNDKISFINDSTTHDTEGTISYDGDTDVMSFDTYMSVDGLITAKGGISVNNNAIASFGNRGILLNGGGIDFKYSTNEAHLVHTKALGLNYNGVACKENFYVDKTLNINNSLLLQNSGSEAEFSYDGTNDVTTISSAINTNRYIESKDYYIIKNGTINFKYGENKESSISADVNTGQLIIDSLVDVRQNLLVGDELNVTNTAVFNGSINANSNIYIGDSVIKGINTGLGDTFNCIQFNDNGENKIEFSPLNQTILIGNNDGYCSFIYTSDNNTLGFDANFLVESNITANSYSVNTGYSTDKFTINNNNDKKITLSSTTDKVTESTSISNTDVVVSYNGNNNSSVATLGKDSLTINSEDGFNGISKAIYTANSISISNTDNDGAYTNTIELSAIDNSIRFITKTSDNKTTSYKFNIQKAIELGLLTKE